jgi:3-oxoacyl-[acyl-carrier-protein] synthase III
MSEPAIASLLAGRLQINDAPKNVMEKRSLAFDVLNGGLGFLEACYLSTVLIPRRRAKAVLVATSEVENNAQVLPDKLRGIAETGAAVILDTSPDGDVGFGSFSFRSFPEHASALNVWCSTFSLQDGDRFSPHLVIERDARIEETFAECAATATEAFLAEEGLERDDIAVFLPPQISPAFIDRFSELVGVERSKCVDISKAGVDLFTATLPYCLNHIIENNTIQKGDVGLLVNVAAGLEVGCATYHF